LNAQNTGKIDHLSFQDPRRHPARLSAKSAQTSAFLEHGSPSNNLFPKAGKHICVDYFSMSEWQRCVIPEVLRDPTTLSSV
jgi:hypothetical protein